MRVGFITQLLWSRYGDFWVRLLNDIGAETHVASAAQTLPFMDDRRLDEIPGLAFRLAAAQSLALSDMDLILAPALNAPSDVARGGGQDPWIASFAEALGTRLAGLPPVAAVPASLAEPLETSAVELLLSLSRDPALVRRVWARHRTRARPPKYPPVRWAPAPSDKEVVGLIGQPWNLSDALVRALTSDDVHGVAQHYFNPALLREEAWRADPRLIATDAELLGAARLFDRRGTVKRLHIILDRESGADAWLLERAIRTVRKPLTPLYLQALDDPVSLLSVD